MDFYLTPTKIGTTLELLEGASEKIVAAEIMYEKEAEEHVVKFVVSIFDIYQWHNIFITYMDIINELLYNLRL